MSLEKVDQIILSKLNCEASKLAEAAQYLLSLGGKRLRPKLCLAVNQLLSPKAHSDICKIAAGIELIHMATLLHDDIIDKSNLRRHQISPRIKFGEDCTLLSGDFLLVRAFGICSDFDEAIVRATEQACIELTEGEILETPLNREPHNLESYKNIAIKKTASLFRLACFCGAHLAEVGTEQEQHWAHFGEKLGLAYQMLDDIADASLDQEELGKPSGLDLIEKKPSLVNILWLNLGSELAQELLLSPGVITDIALTSLALTELRTSSKALSQALEIALATEKAAFDYFQSYIQPHNSINNQDITELKLLFSALSSKLVKKIN